MLSNRKVNIAPAVESRTSSMNKVPTTFVLEAPNLYKVSICCLRNLITKAKMRLRIMKDAMATQE